MYLFSLAVIMVLSCILLLSCQKYEESMKYTDITTSNQITGSLGSPLGTIMTIRGRIYTGARSKAEEDAFHFHVFQVDGKKLAQPVIISLESFAWLDLLLPGEGETVSYIGYETGGMTGIPEQAFEHMDRVATTDFHFSVYFQVIKQVD
jgi:hypothetical protein